MFFCCLNLDRGFDFDLDFCFCRFGCLLDCGAVITTKIFSFFFACNAVDFGSCCGDGLLALDRSCFLKYAKRVDLLKVELPLLLFPGIMFPGVALGLSGV